MNNLNELRIYGCKYENDFSDVEIIEMTFANVTKLDVKDFHKLDFDPIAKLNFPKLECVTITSLRSSGYIPKSFFDKIKHIKYLHMKCCYCDNFISILSQLDQLEYLTNLVWDKFTSYAITKSHISKCFNILAHHNSLRNIKLKFCDDQMKINKRFYKKLNRLCKIKPNTKTLINVIKDETYETSQYDQYKKLFDESKQLYKLNMELLISKEVDRGVIIMR